ncbi:MAG: hypothetical protein COB02_05240 [Candidatus Cloacimonadota bacterium]|nr:MAG: hypothetical protein COB02_05240 [Candidatus Cloacimonadota bacterium]
MYIRFFYILFFVFILKAETKSQLLPFEKSILIKAILKECPSNFKSIRFAIIDDDKSSSQDLYHQLKKNTLINYQDSSISLEFHFIKLKKLLEKKYSYDFIFYSKKSKSLFSNYKVISDRFNLLKEGAFIVILKDKSTPKVILNLQTLKKYQITFSTTFMRFVEIYSKKINHD